MDVSDDVMVDCAARTHSQQVEGLLIVVGSTVPKFSFALDPLSSPWQRRVCV